VLHARGALCSKRVASRSLQTALLGWAEAVEEGQRLRAVGVAVKVLCGLAQDGRYGQL